MAEYKSLTELSAFGGNVSSQDQLLISRKPDSTNAGYVSYHAAVSSFAQAISDLIAVPMKDYVTNGLGNLSSVNKQDLEYDGSNKLTSFVPKGDAGIKSIGLSNWAISAIAWNDDKLITDVSGINLTDISASILRDVVDMLIKRGLNSGISVLDNTSNKGVVLATIEGGQGPNLIYSGDPRNTTNIEAMTTVGEPIAKVTYCDGGTVVIKNNLSVSQIKPDFGANLNYCGNTIATINGTTLKNNLSVTTLTDDGQQIANINGIILKNGSTVTTTDVGLPIATINGTQIFNGINLHDVETCDTAKPICKINDTQIYNNVDVTDHTNANAEVDKEFKQPIATVNGIDLYNGIQITDDVPDHQTYINGHKILGGIKLGSVNPVATQGNVIAEIESATKGLVQLRSGIIVDNVKNDIISLLRAEIEQLKKQHEADIATLRREMQQYVKLVSSTQQIVSGPIKFTNTIDGNITNANYATKANWS